MKMIELLIEKQFCSNKYKEDWNDEGPFVWLLLTLYTFLCADENIYLLLLNEESYPSSSPKVKWHQSGCQSSAVGSACQ